MGLEFDAVKARLQSSALLAAKVFDSARRDPDNGLIRDTYVILWGGGPSSLDDGRLTVSQMTDSDAEYDFPIQAVSTTASGARATADLVRSLLLGFTPTISGRNCNRVKLTTPSGDVKVDDSVKPPLFFIDDIYVLRSSRA